jgi:hypothetical protein
MDEDEIGVCMLGSFVIGTTIADENRRRLQPSFRAKLGDDLPL